MIRQKKALMSISENAYQRLKYLLNKQQDKNFQGIKINIVQRGCNGLSYKLDYVEEKSINKLDEVIQQKDLKIVVDSKAVMFLVGTEMDYIEDDLKSEFVFNNPNAKGHCGCGESFHI